jgi:hypothetical protein
MRVDTVADTVNRLVIDTGGGFAEDLQSHGSRVVAIGFAELSALVMGGDLSAHVDVRARRTRARGALTGTLGHVVSGSRAPAIDTGHHTAGR